MGAAPEFFAALNGRRDEPTLQHLTGTIRFNLRADDAIETWFVTLRDGEVAVSRRASKPDCTATMDSDLFEAMLRGDENAVAAALRGDMEMEGQLALLLAFQRLFPGPPSDRRESAQMMGAGND